MRINAARRLGVGGRYGVKAERRREEGWGRKYAEEGVGESSAEDNVKEVRIASQGGSSRPQNIEKVSWVYLPYILHYEQNCR